MSVTFPTLSLCPNDREMSPGIAFIHHYVLFSSSKLVKIDLIISLSHHPPYVQVFPVGRGRGFGGRKQAGIKRRSDPARMNNILWCVFRRKLILAAFKLRQSWSGNCMPRLPAN
jgi:hypothetical protein